MGNARKVAALALGAIAFLAAVVPAAADPPRRRAIHARRSAAARVSARYARMRRHWHAPASERERRAFARAEVPPLSLRPVHGGPPGVLTPDPASATLFGPDDLSVARLAFAPRGATVEREIHPRLLELLLRAVRRFHAPWVNLVSGVRDTRASSRHAQGRAADVVLPGVSDPQLAAFFRMQGFVGVGMYPASGFVHVDVRARSYFWVDRSGPGQANRTREILERAAREMDRRARRRGEEPTVDPEATGPDVDSDSELTSDTQAVEQTPLPAESQP